MGRVWAFGRFGESAALRLQLFKRQVRGFSEKVGRRGQRVLRTLLKELRDRVTPRLLQTAGWEEYILT